MRLPSTNALAVLGLLGIAPMTAYGIAEQTQRALGYVWSVSRSLLLGQPRKLADVGLVETLAPVSGSRASRRWAASDLGRTVLCRWLDTDVEPTRVSSELGLRLLFADQGDLVQLRRQLQVRRKQLRAALQEGISFTDPYLEARGPFPERLHIVAAVMVLVEHQVMGELLGVEEVQRLVSRWSDTTTVVNDRDLEVLRQSQTRLVEALRRLDDTVESVPADALD